MSKMVMKSETLDFLAEKPRVAGSRRNEEIAGFLLDKYSSLGYDVSVDEHRFMGWKLLEEPQFSFLKPKRKKAATTQMVWSGSTEGKFRGKLVSSGVQLTFEAYPFRKYSIVDEDGKEQGYVLTRPDMVWLQSLTNAMDNMPCCLIDTKSCRQIERWQKQGKEIEAEFSIKTKYMPNTVLRNVIATKKGRAKKEIVVCAHYDSVPDSPGANDNASGTLVLLKLAEVLSKEDFRHTIRLVSFDAEEWNKQGAYMYVEKRRQKVSENKARLGTKTARYLKKQTELDKIKAVVNIDTVGAGKTIYNICSKKYAGLVKASAKESGMNVEVRSGYNAPQFDGWAFHVEGVPVIHFGVYPYKYFHTPEDTKEKVNLKLIDDVAGLIEKIVDSLDKD